MLTFQFFLELLVGSVAFIGGLMSNSFMFPLETHSLDY